MNRSIPRIFDIPRIRAAGTNGLYTVRTEDARARVVLCFADPHRARQKGSNGRLDSLLRALYPNGWELSRAAPAALKRGPALNAGPRSLSPRNGGSLNSVIRSGALNQAGYLQAGNPALAVALPRYRKNKRAAWSENEARRALELCQDSALKLSMYLALDCSMRIGEILGLTWDCVHRSGPKQRAAL